MRVPFSFIKSSGPADPILGTAGRVFDLNAALGVTATTTVSVWNEQSGVADVNRSLIQATALNRPTYNATDAAYNNKPTVQGVAAFSTCLVPSGTWGTTISQPCTIYLVGQVGASGSLIDGGPVTGRIGFFDNGLGDMGMTAGGGAFLLPGGTPSTPGVYAYLVNGASSEAYANRLSTPGTADPGSNIVERIQCFVYEVGGGYTGYSDGKIARFLIYTGLHDLTTRTAITNALGVMYGISISP